MSQEKWVVKGSDSVAAIGQSALFRFFFSSFWLVIRFPAALLAHRLTFQVYPVSIVNRSIHDAVGNARVTVMNRIDRRGLREAPRGTAVRWDATLQCTILRVPTSISTNT